MELTKILASEIKITTDRKIKCGTCPQPAVTIWPAVSDRAGAYCEPCAEKARHRLLIAIGSASSI